MEAQRYASVLLANSTGYWSSGTRYQIAQEQLGHSSISTTLNIYTHVVDASHRKAIEALERELFPSVPKLPDGPKPANSASRDFRVA